MQSTLTQEIDHAAHLRFYSDPQDNIDVWMNIVAQRVNASSMAVWLQPDSTPLIFNEITHCFSEQFAEALGQVWDTQQGVMFELGKSRYALFCPIQWQEQIFAVAFSEVIVDKPTLLPGILNEMQWSSAWLIPAKLDRQNQELHHLTQHNQDMLSLFSELFAESDPDLALQGFVSRLAILLNVDRVFLGEINVKKAKISHVSGLSLPKNETEWVSQIQNAMLEAADQNNSLVWSVEKFLITKVHHTIAIQKQLADIATALVRDQAQNILGAITVERDNGEPLSAEQQKLLETLGVLLGPALLIQKKNMASLPKLIKERIQKQGQSFRKNRTLHVICGVLILSVIAINTIKLPYRLAGDAVVEAAKIQTLSAPFDGFIKSINARPGDAIAQQQILVTLEDRELILQQLRWQAEIAKLNTTYQEAIGLFDRTKQSEVEAELLVAQTELNIVQTKLSKTQITAPFTALLVEGDLRQRIGDVVSQGEPLMSIAPANEFQLQIQIPEAKIEDVVLGTKGDLYLNAFPQDKWQVEITRIIPNSQYNEGEAFFMVEAKLTSDSELLRPGLRGVAKLDIDKRTIWTLMTQDISAWLRQKMWAIWG